MQVPRHYRVRACLGVTMPVLPGVAVRVLPWVELSVLLVLLGRCGGREGIAGIAVMW